MTAHHRSSSTPARHEELVVAPADALGRRLPPCAAEPDVWTETDRLAPEQLERAQHGCARCPATSACLDLARAVKPACGVWAGHHVGPGRPLPRPAT